MATQQDTQPAMCYPSEEQYGKWKTEAQERDMSVSEWMQAMVEAGRKKFGRDVEPDKDLAELRQDREELRRELQTARRRVERLENRVYSGERAAIFECLEENPGASYGEIVQYVSVDLPDRVTETLDELEGTKIRVDNGEHHLIEGDQ